MLDPTTAFSGFSVDDVERVVPFYRDVLGVPVDVRDGMLSLELGPRTVLVYPKGPAHAPASFTVLNFPVDDVPGTVRELTARGVRIERYEGTPVATDDEGVFRGGVRSSPGSPTPRATCCRWSRPDRRPAPPGGTRRTASDAGAGSTQEVCYRFRPHARPGRDRYGLSVLVGGAGA
ncbi:VOC family protein [Cellulomonas marina]|uniref:Glyoxalase/fosfomycin resistance/dioxygenase domain-containing protein n=1 Tax=Cellulomonas marina TaxID=988821 RepID=A0A1I0ZUM0_9CELL|nr:VOC family protein [Cellulomonas marina]GIG28828.1 hypothetical protein Cma02nite_14280 [Cellulomonas marina]SFB28008.1 hypothetical protein SAMN05421867_11268 [Cellulomonas marina]